VVDRVRQVLEEPLQRLEIVGVEGRGALSIDVERRTLEALGIPGREDDVSPLGACASRCFEPDSGASADEDDRLPEEFRFALGATGTGVGGHDAAGISPRRAFSPAT
jgi:hypothetical protein